MRDQPVAMLLFAAAVFLVLLVAGIWWRLTSPPPPPDAQPTTQPLVERLRAERERRMAERDAAATLPSTAPAE